MQPGNGCLGHTISTAINGTHTHGGVEKNHTDSSLRPMFFVNKTKSIWHQNWHKLQNITN